MAPPAAAIRPISTRETGEKPSKHGRDQQLYSHKFQVRQSTRNYTIELVDIECVLGDVIKGPDVALINPAFWMLRTLFL